MTYNKLFLILLALTALVWAKDCVPNISWKGKGGKVLPPQIELREEGGRQVVHCSPVESEPWQGAIGELDEPVNLSDYRGVAFDFRQGFYPGNPAVVFYINTSKGAIYTDFSGGQKDWIHVELPFDQRLWKGAEKHGFGITKSFTVYPYQVLDSPAKYLEIANVRLLAKDGKPEENRDISVRSYQLDTKPDDGEIASQCLLISGNTSDLSWRGYGQCEPSITFDLGTIYAVTEMQIFASGEQHQQNFRNATVLASLDGKTFHPAGVINGSTLENGRQKYRLNAPFAARHVRLLPIRLRQDFPVRIAEVKFRGHIPDSDELARLSERSYDLGRPLPKDSGNNYLSVGKGAISFRVCRENGVLCDLRWKGRLVALQQFVRYDLMRRKSGTSADSFAARVSAVEETPGGVRVTSAIPAMPGLTFVQDFAVEENGVRTTVTVKEIEKIEPAILRLSHETILAQDFRKGGFYESWGAHHRLTRIAAAEVVTEQSIDGVASLTFETAGGGTTLLQTILAHDGRFLPIGSTVEESATQFFLPNGLRMCNGLMNIGRDATPHSMTSLLQLNDGSLLQAYDFYLNRQECREFWGKLHRASWLRDVKLVVSMGDWEGGWKGGHARAAANLNRMYEFDPLLAPMIGGCEYTWGDFPTEGILRGGFGGGYEAEEAKANLRKLRAAAPNLKQGFYTWLWSAGVNSKVYRDHPDWFVTKTREGAVANYFPGPEITLNYFRSYLDPASLQEAVNAICRSCNAFDLDIWYLDGGGTNTVAIDWEKCAIDSPLNAIALHQTIRENIQRDNPERAVFFNTPYNPQGDFGYLESFSDIITAWRSGAAWMYKFKLFQHRNPLHYPIYIYWLGTVSGPLEEYMVGTGLLASNHSHGDRLRDVGYISARHEVRQLRLMDAHVAPDWRFDQNCTVEALPLEQGGTGLIFLKHHGDKPLPTTVSFDTAPYAIPAGRPVHQWLLAVKNARKYACQFGEPDLRKGYAQSDWLADRVLVPKYLGTVAMNEPRFSRELELPPEQAVLYEFSSVPAIIWSYRGHPAYHRLAGTPAVRITGDYETLAVDAEEPNTEIAVIVPPGQLPDAITINGQPAQWRLFRDNGAILAIVKLEKAGHNALTSRFRAATTLAGTCQLQAKVENGTLKAAVTVPSGWTGRNLLLSVSDGDTTVWSREQPVTGTELACALDLPHIVCDGRYTLSAGLPWGEIAGVAFEVKGVARPTKLEEVMPVRKTVAKESECQVQAGGMSIRRTFTAITEGCGTAEMKPQELSLELSSNLMYETYFNQLACGMELAGVKRYVKVALESNFWFFNQTTSCQVGRHSPRYDNPTHYLGLYLDFGTAQGYTTRVAGGYGKYDIKNHSVFPSWGAKRLPSRKWMLCNHTKAMERERTELWLDMQRMGAPEDWNGSLIASLAMTVVSPDRKISLRILETADELPGDETAATPLALDVSEPRQIFSIKQVSAPPDNSAWEAAPVLGEMRDIGNRALKDPMPIQVKALRDATTLYVRYDATEPPGKIFDCLKGRDGLPYFSDGVELLLGLADQRDLQLHIVVDMEGHDFVHTAALTAEAKKRTARLRDFPYRKKLLVDNPEKWTIILEIPLNALGVTEPATLPFNAMANRVVNGKMVNLSLAPVFFSKDHFQLRL